MKLNKNLSSPIYFFIFFIATCSYIPIFEIAEAKYISIFATLVFVGIVLLKKTHIKKGKILLFLYLYIVLIISCFFQNTEIPLKLFSVFYYTVLLVWGIYGEYCIKSTQNLFYIGIGIFWGALLGLGLTLDQVLFQINNPYNSRDRIWGGFNHPNALGSILLTAAVVLFCYLQTAEAITKKRKRVIIILISLSLLMLYLTNSRTSIILAVIFYFVFYLKLILKFNLKLKIFLLVSIGVILAVVVYDYAIYALQDTAFIMRLQIFSDITITPQTFFVGNGMVDSSNLDLTNANGNPMEIAWVTLFYKNGIIGVIAFCVLLTFLLLRGLKIKNKTNKQLFFSIYLAFLIGTIGEAYMVNVTNVQPMVFWILLSYFSRNLVDNDLSAEKVRI